MGWLAESEDLNRHYVWGGYPFWAWPFFEYAMSIPDEYKSRDKFQHKFMDRIDKRLLSIPYADTGETVTSIQHRVKTEGFNFLLRHLWLRKLLKRTFSVGTGFDDDIRQKLRNRFQVRNGTPWKSETRSTIDSPSLTTEEANTLLTAVTATSP